MLVENQDVHFGKKSGKVDMLWTSSTVANLNFLVCENYGDDSSVVLSSLLFKISMVQFKFYNDPQGQTTIVFFSRNTFDRSFKRKVQTCSRDWVVILRTISLGVQKRPCGDFLLLI